MLYYHRIVCTVKKKLFDASQRFHKWNLNGGYAVEISVLMDNLSAADGQARPTQRSNGGNVAPHAHTELRTEIARTYLLGFAVPVLP